MFLELRNRVNRKRKMCRANYYQAKVEHLKKCKSTEWWKEVKMLSARSLASSAQSDTLQSLQHLYESIDQNGLANIINEAFLSPMYCFTPLPAAFLCTTFSNYSENSLVVSVESVRKKLSKLNPCKANGPDNIPGWFLKENADILAGPAARLYFLRQLKRVKVPTNDLLSFYTTCIRPVALHIISNNELSYRQALDVFSIPTLYARREAIGNSMFQDIGNNNNHKLHSLLPPPYSGTLRTWKNRKCYVPCFKTNRFRDSFIVSHCR